MPETTTPTPSTPKLTFATIITLVAIVAQGLMTAELFAPSSVPGKVLQVLAMVLTALGAPIVVRTSSKALPVALLVLMLGAVTLPSGCSHDTRAKTIHATLVTADTAHAGFVAWDRAHQLELVSKAQTREEARAALDAYREKRAGLEEKLVGVYRAIAAAALANDDQSLLSLLAAADQLHKALVALTGGKIP